MLHEPTTWKHHTYLHWTRTDSHTGTYSTKGSGCADSQRKEVMGGTESIATSFTDVHTEWERQEGMTMTHCKDGVSQWLCSWRVPSPCSSKRHHNHEVSRPPIACCWLGCSLPGAIHCHPVRREQESAKRQHCREWVVRYVITCECMCV